MIRFEMIHYDPHPWQWGIRIGATIAFVFFWLYLSGRNPLDDRFNF